MDRQSKHKNILFIISDQHRADFLGKVNPKIKTPNLDSLCNNGIHFKNAITTSPICGPARTSMFTGLYPHQAKGELAPDPTGARQEENTAPKETNMMINFSSLREQPELTRRLKACGYQTAYAGKWHLGDDIIHQWFDKADGFCDQDYIDWAELEQGIDKPWPLQDFDVRSHRTPHMSIPKTKVLNVPLDKTNDAWITDIALKYIEERDPNQPFFITCSMNGPHPPFKVPEPYFSMYNPEDFSEPVNFLPAANEPSCKGDSFYRRLWEDQGTHWKHWQKSVAVYAGFVSYIDAQVGRLINKLKEENLIDNTLIVYCSDHGEQLGQHGLWQKFQPYEESIQIPLIISNTNLTPSVDEHITSLVDLPATFLSFAQSKQDEHHGEGYDLLGKQRQQRQLLFSEQEPLGDFHNEVAWRMVRDKHYKYIWNFGDRDEFYDLIQDPTERVNLIHRVDKELLSHYRQALSQWLKKSKDPMFDTYSIEQAPQIQVK